MSNFYNKKVIILERIVLPETFFNTKINEYSGDSIIMLLSKLKKGPVVETIGLTHKAIYTIKESRIMRADWDQVDNTHYYDENIFGIGYVPGNSCVISDYKFITTDTTVYYHRLRNVIIHEVGHNAGLSHCSDKRCIMSEANGNVPALDKGGNDYCDKCRKQLK